MDSTFTLDDFRKQLEQIARPSLIQRLFGLMPGMGEMQRMLQSSEHQREMRRLSGMIDSMTPGERFAPQSIDLSRRQRIAQGSGVTPREVNELINQFESMAKLMNKMAGDGRNEAIDRMRKLRQGGPIDEGEDQDDEPWDDDDILGT